MKVGPGNTAQPLSARAASATAAPVGPPQRRPVVRLWPGVRAPRLLLDLAAREDLSGYRRQAPDAGQFEVDLDQLAEIADAAGIRGRGGAGFPLARKLLAVADAAAESPGFVHVVANGEEGEPASAKDRYLLLRRPHVVLDGLLLAATALRATRAHVYLSEPELVAPIEESLAELELPMPVEVFLAPKGYVSGEETAVVRAISGGPAKPTDKPPRPFTSGVSGRPTLVSNVETLAHLARAVRFGVDTVAQDGVDGMKGTTLVTVTPDDGTPYLVEVPFGLPLEHVLAAVGESPRGPEQGLLVGGFFGGFVPRALRDVPLGHDAMRRAGLGLGCAAFLPLHKTCPVSAAADLLAFFDRENSRQCGACFNGTTVMHQALARLCTGRSNEQDVSNLRRWGATLPGRGACGTLDGAARIASTLLDQYGVLVDRHLEKHCGPCADDSHDRSETRFRVGWSDLTAAQRRGAT